MKELEMMYYCKEKEDMVKSLTEMEKQILVDITKDCFYDNGVDSEIWADCFLDTTKISAKQARGVLSSLVQKGIIYPIEKGRNGTIAFTNCGKEVMKKLGY